MAFKVLEKYGHWKASKDKKLDLADCTYGGGECGAGGCSTSCSGSGCGWDD